jgi:chromosome segregation ATPase
MKTKVCFVLVLGFVLLLTPIVRADDARLKETLRVLTQRLRAAETERNNLLSDKAACDQEKKTLTEKVDALTKQAVADEGQIDTLKAKTDAQGKELADTKDALAKWKAAHEQLLADAKKIESERARFAGEAAVLKRTVEDRERKNRELYRLGNEILTRYEKFGLGEALTAREPFTGITRVKLENLVQDYQDKLADQRVKQ